MVKKQRSNMTCFNDNDANHMVKQQDWKQQPLAMTLSLPQGFRVTLTTGHQSVKHEA
jgi:hypothetical protein